MASEPDNGKEELDVTAAQLVTRLYAEGELLYRRGHSMAEIREGIVSAGIHEHDADHGPAGALERRDAPVLDVVQGFQRRPHPAEDLLELVSVLDGLARGAPAHRLRDGAAQGGLREIELRLLRRLGRHGRPARAGVAGLGLVVPLVIGALRRNRAQLDA